MTIKNPLRMLRSGFFVLFRNTLDGAGLHRASAANDTEQHGDDGDDQQNVNDATRYEVTEETDGPDDDEDDGDEIQQIAHG